LSWLIFIIYFLLLSIAGVLKIGSKWNWSLVLVSLFSNERDIRSFLVDYSFDIQVDTSFLDFYSHILFNLVFGDSVYLSLSVRYSVGKRLIFEWLNSLMSSWLISVDIALLFFFVLILCSVGIIFWSIYIDSSVMTEYLTDNER
jgi:hypothetical protein